MALLIILILIVAAFLPALIWLIFFIKEDIHPEPKRLIAYTFLIGAFATAPALVFQLGIKNFISENKIFLSFLILALIEEVIKFLAAYYAMHKNPFFDEPIDAMVYMVAVAGGFATVENILIALSSIDTFSISTIYSISHTLLLRFVGATLLHILASGIIGYGWAKIIAKKSHYGSLIQCIIIAILVHTIFNYLILVFQENNLLYPSLTLVLAAFFVLNDFETLKKAESPSASA